MQQNLSPRKCSDVLLETTDIMLHVMFLKSMSCGMHFHAMFKVEMKMRPLPSKVWNVALTLSAKTGSNTANMLCKDRQKGSSLTVRFWTVVFALCDCMPAQKRIERDLWYAFLCKGCCKSFRVLYVISIRVAWTRGLSAQILYWSQRKPVGSSAFAISRLQSFV